MLITDNQRPGVYSGYTVEGLYAAPRARRYAAVVLPGAAQAAGTVHRCSPRTPWAEALGQDSANDAIIACVRLLLNGGVPQVLVSAVDGDLTAALALLENEDNIAAVICTADSDADKTALLAYVEREQARLQEKIAFIGGNGTPTEAAASAKKLNHPRCCLCYPGAVGADGTEAASAFSAAALAAAVLAADDPVYNWNSAQLPGLSHCERLAEEDIQALLAAGVTVLEEKAQAVRCIRAVTTKTGTAGVPDNTLRALNTVLIIDDVMRSLRETLQARMAGRRLSPDSIRTQAAVVLAEKQEDGILESFAVPEVYTAPEDPTVCVVEIAFRVAQVLSQIHIVAHINI